MLSSLISCYPFENNALDPVGGRNGTLVGDATFSSNVPSTIAGFSTRSLSLDGSIDKAVYDVQGADSVVGAFTVAMWVNPSDLNPTKAFTFFGTRHPNNISFDIKFRAANVIRTDVGDGSHWLAIHDTRSLPISVGTWYHVAVTVTPTGDTIYFNGSAVSSRSYGPATPILWSANNDLAIGDVDARVINGEEFHGFIDDVRIFNTALSGAEIGDLFQAPCNTPADIAMLSAQLQAGNTVQFTYDTTGNPGPFDVGLYRSADATFDSSDAFIDTQTITPGPTNPQAPGTFTRAPPRSLSGTIRQCWTP